MVARAQKCRQKAMDFQPLNDPRHAATHEAGHVVVARVLTTAKPAGRSRSRNQQRLHVCAACHLGTRRLRVLSQFSLLDQRARNNKRLLKAVSVP
jgi:hypothetical protein